MNDAMHRPARRGRPVPIARIASSLLLLCLAESALAQSTYRCGVGRGAYLSGHPCPSGEPHTLRSIGPVPERPDASRNPYTPPLRKAPEVLAYLSPECAQLNDAIRTGPTRGLKGTDMADLHADYSRRCGEDEQRAQRKMSQEKRDDRARRDTEQVARNQSAAQARLGADQCSDMLGILASKRKRALAMTEGERGDLALFETNYRSRCKS